MRRTLIINCQESDRRAARLIHFCSTRTDLPQAEYTIIRFDCEAAPEGDYPAAKVRPGNLHSAEDREELLLPETERQQKPGKEAVSRADAAFAKPETHEALQKRGVRHSV
jgi:hypothetical protein